VIQNRKKRYKGGYKMPVSLRIPLEKERKIRKAAAKSGKTKTAYILEAVDEKLGLQKTRGQIIKELAGWMPHAEAEELRRAVEVFNTIHQGDWD
jgi:predicted DNA-binding protein